jgi:ABC-2 type transport system ATP-binding protein
MHLLNDLKSNDQVFSVFPFGQYMHVTLVDENGNMEDLSASLKENGHKHVEVKPADAGIEDMFMYLMNLES